MTEHSSRSLIEQGAILSISEPCPNQHEVELSKAISLKRIADALSTMIGESYREEEEASSPPTRDR